MKKKINTILLVSMLIIIIIESYTIILSKQNISKLSFNKRGFLTLSGNFSANEKPTQKRITYINNDSNCIVNFNIIYLNKPLENDLIFWRDSGAKNKNIKEIFNNYKEMIFSYKNSLIKIDIHCKDGYDIPLSLMNKIGKATIKILQKNEK
ncbi:hypothetical protein OW763_13700 [Clostridium aestuarii]|uniref:DUF4367 domain-containing protein n=1 Tax=Clostridium aestuarii TaxID=338193 RepID=A0ABT4D2B1_9CLOT|nr:hypothetical protein [Clostridium aestuarii]MCY6485386.1 hypothetical protein [Clostridium aestuarii]